MDLAGIPPAAGAAFQATAGQKGPLELFAYRSLRSLPALFDSPSIRKACHTACFLWTWRESRRRLKPPFRPRRGKKVHWTFLLTVRCAHSPPCSIPLLVIKKACRLACFFMDLGGIEPPSENLSLGVSPITASPFTFPQSRGEGRPRGFGSFMLRLHAQSFACIVSRNHNAGDREYGDNRADGHSTQAATANVLSLAFNFKGSGFIVVRATDGFPDFKTPVETSTSPGVAIVRVAKCHLCDWLYLSTGVGGCQVNRRLNRGFIFRPVMNCHSHHLPI